MTANHAVPAAPSLGVPLEQAQDEVEYRLRTALARVIAADRHGEEYPKAFVEEQITSGKARLQALANTLDSPITPRWSYERLQTFLGDRTVAELPGGGVADVMADGAYIEITRPDGSAVAYGKPRTA